MKVTIYELLGMVKDDKAPKRIMYNDIVWDYIEIEGDYRSRHNAELFFNDETNNTWIMTHLNTKVEIIEEPQEHKIPKKLEYWQGLDKVRNDCELDDLEYAIKYGNYNFEMFFDKINEILDYLEVNNDRKR